MGDAIIVLGHTNNEDGTLSVNARSRLDCAIALLHKGAAKEIVLSGGRGNHFNTSEKPHAFWMRKYLESRAIPQKIITREEWSRWTIENASLCLEIAKERGWKDVIIVTSSWHGPRAKMIFWLLWPSNIRREFALSKDPAIPRPKIILTLWEAKGFVRDFFIILLYKLTGRGLRTRAAQFGD